MAAGGERRQLGRCAHGREAVKRLAQLALGVVELVIVAQGAAETEMRLDVAGRERHGAPIGLHGFARPPLPEMRLAELDPEGHVVRCDVQGAAEGFRGGGQRAFPGLHLALRDQNAYVARGLFLGARQQPQGLVVLPLPGDQDREVAQGLDVRRLRGQHLLVFAPRLGELAVPGEGLAVVDAQLVIARIARQQLGVAALGLGIIAAPGVGERDMVADVFRFGRELERPGEGRLRLAEAPLTGMGLAEAVPGLGRLRLGTGRCVEFVARGRRRGNAAAAGQSSSARIPLRVAVRSATPPTPADRSRSPSHAGRASRRPPTTGD